MKSETTIKASRFARLLWDEWILRPLDFRYNIGFMYEISGNLDRVRLIDSLRCLLHRNPILRSSFHEDHGTLMQTFHYNLDNTIEFHDCSDKSKEQIDSILKSRCELSFDLSQAPLFNFAIIKANAETHFLSLRFHHIIVDGSCLKKVPESIARFYGAPALDLATNIPDSPLLNEYLNLEESVFNNEPLLEAGLQYWRNLLQGGNFFTNLPGRKATKDLSAFSVKSINFTFNEELFQKVQGALAKFKCTTFHLMSAIWSAFLRKCSNQKRISMIHPVGMRPKSMIDLDGYLVNSLPIVVDYTENSTLAGIVKHIKEQRTRSKAHRFIPFDQVIHEYNKTTAVRYGQQHSNYLNAAIIQSDEILTTTLVLSDLATKVIPTQTLINAEICLIYRKDPTGIHCQICYNDALLEDLPYSSADEHLLHLADNLLSAPEQPIDSIPLLDGQERQRIVHDWNKTEAEFHREKTIHQLFEEQVERTPENMAVTCEDECLTYHELNEKANQLAHAIRREYQEFCGEKVTGDTLIGLYLERGIDMIIGVLGILKAGAAYVPFDLADPEERLRFKINDCGCKLIVTSSRSLEDLVFLTELDTLPIALDAYAGEIAKMPRENPEPINDAHNLAYVIYTSGSTGKPKGVMTEHYGVVNFIEYHLEKFPTTRQFNDVSQSVSINFDASWTELALALFNGSTLHIIKSIAHLSGFQLAQFIKQKRINIFISTPALIRVLPKDIGSGLELLISGGDVGEKTIMDYWSERLTFLNAYGPTEATICTTYSWHSREKSNRNIGRPLQNKKLYILDQNLNPVPPGFHGELYIGGEGLARGYLNRPELTTDRFVANPFLLLRDDVAARGASIYRTGDIASWTADGSIEFHERNDDQVKINGFRIELGEIESKLAELPAIDRCVVVCRERSGTKFLIAYYSAEETLAAEAVEKHLLERIPHYMIPGCFIQLPELPLTVNGKIDRHALPEPEDVAPQESFVPPRNPVQQQLCQIVQQLLGVARVGIKDDFFRLGGDSIISIQLTSKLRDLGYQISVKDIFDQRTIDNLAGLIRENRRAKAIEAEQGILEGSFALLPVQKWFFEHGFPKFNHWNQSFLIRVPELEPDRVEKAMLELATRHDALRLRFGKDKDTQRYEGWVVVPELRILDVGTMGPEEIERQLTAWQSNFDIARGPVWQPGYLHGYADGSARIFMAFHHLIVDAVSWRILTQDLKKLLAGEDLPAKTTSYRQWVEAIREYARTQAVETDYWLEQCQNTDEMSIFRNLTDHVSEATVRLSRIDTDLLLTRSPPAYNTEVNDLLLTALAYALQNVLGCTTHLITLEGHGRATISDMIDTSETVGWFTNMHPFRLEVENSIGETIKTVKERIRKIPHQGIGFGALKYHRQNGRLDGQLDERLEKIPFPQIGFNYLGQFDAQTGFWQIVSENAGMTFHPDNNEPGVINLNGMVVQGELEFSIHSRLSAAATRNLAESLQKSLQEVALHCSEKAKSQRSEFTPSDFPLVNISSQLLEKLQQQYEIEEILPVTSLQQGFLSFAIKNPDDDAYRLQFLADYHTALDVAKYETAWKLVMEKYPIMRTCFNWEDEMLQIVCKTAELKLILCDLPPGADMDAEIEKIRVADRAEGFDLAKPGLLRIHLIRTAHDHFTLLKTDHHSISDGWSNPIQLNEVHDIYRELSSGRTPSRREVDRSYIEAQKYIFRHKDEVQKYWHEQIRKFERANDVRAILSVDIDPETITTIKKPLEWKTTISGADYANLREVCRSSGVTMNVLVMFAWHKVLSIFSGDKVTVVGTVVSGRDIPVNGILSSVGLYINTLPHIVGWDEKTTLDQLHQLHSSLTELNEFGSMNIGDLQQGQRRLFHSLFVFENYPTPTDENESPEKLRFTMREAVEKLDYPLGISAFDNDDSLLINLKSGGEFLFPVAAEKLLFQIALILKKIPAALSESHNSISLLAPDEYERIINDWNMTAAEYPADRTIIDMFESQVAMSPDAPALVDGGRSLSYSELNSFANHIAEQIRETYESNLGELAVDTLIGIFIERSVEMIAGILGILKAGAAYVPFDREDPAERLKLKFQDADCKLILSSTLCRASLAAFTEGNAHALFLDELESGTTRTTAVNPSRINRPSDLAYVIYTSGSTGKPKGVMLEHQGVINLATSHRRSFEIGAHSRILQFAPVSFDASVSTLFITLLNGGTLFLCEEETRKDIMALAKFIIDNQITMIDIPAKLCELLPRDMAFPALEHIITAGEVCEKATMDYWQEKVMLINAYGPTEATVCATFSIHNAMKGNQNIGKPIANKTVYVLDERLNPVPPGAPGELYIGGDGLARGYLNRPDLTRERFLPDPFRAENGPHTGKARMYKTGDLVRWLPEGDLQFIRRNDNQIKIRGYRIELQEIEDKVQSFPGVQECVVKTFDRNGNPFLCAYYTVGDDAIADDAIADLTPNRLKEHISALLPDYMVPAFFVRLDKMPLNTSGKLDRIALPAPESKADEAVFLPPRNEIEEKVCAVWQQLLQLTEIGIQDDFFAAGGNSILAIRAVHKMTEVIGRDISVADLFEKRTIAGFGLETPDNDDRETGEEIEL